MSEYVDSIPLSAVYGSDTINLFHSTNSYKKSSTSERENSFSTNLEEGSQSYTEIDLSARRRVGVELIWSYFSKQCNESFYITQLWESRRRCCLEGATNIVLKALCRYFVLAFCSLFIQSRKDLCIGFAQQFATQFSSWFSPWLLFTKKVRRQSKFTPRFRYSGLEMSMTNVL